MTLRDAPLQRDVTISAIHLDERHRFRMLELGLRAGTVVRVTQKASFGGRVVARGNERIALDGATARSIDVALKAPIEGRAGVAVAPVGPQA